jgi:hypothetical protein
MLSVLQYQLNPMGEFFMKLRLSVWLVLLTLLIAAPLSAQVDEPIDTIDIETLPPDTTFEEWEPVEDDTPEPPKSTTFVPRSGIFGGPTIEFSQLDPAKLDPLLAGNLVMYGGEGFVILNGFMLGGGAIGATLYDMSPSYDEFSYGYGGFLTGYDITIVKPFSFRADLMIGGGGLKMIRKRPDLAAGDSSGHEILERVRNENFFMFRPGVSLGFSPIPILDFRLGVNYLFPVGGEDVDDLKNLSFGLHMFFGFGG